MKSSRSLWSEKWWRCLWRRPRWTCSRWKKRGRIRQAGGAGVPACQAGRERSLKAEFVNSSGKPATFPADRLPEVAFLGRSNVGKSSLINALAGRKGLAFTSNTPGRTQTINFYRIKNSMYFVDLPGYGYARVPLEVTGQWRDLIEGYLLTRETLDLSLLILDARRGWME